MSYGKDDSQLGRIAGFGATPSQQMGNAARRQQGPRKGTPPWANNFRPSQGTPDYIRLIPGQFEAERINETTGEVFKEQVPWFEYTEHFHGTLKRSSVCSAGIHRMDKSKALPCRGCEIYWEDWRVRKQIEQEKGVKPTGPNRVSFSSRYAFLVLDMGWFYKGVRLDDSGRPVINQQNGQPFVDWIKYKGPHQDADFQAAAEKRQGMVQSWPIGYNQFGMLGGYADIVQKHCRNCGGQNCIHTSSWVCPACSAPTLLPSESTLPPDKVKELVSKMVACRTCKQLSYPRALQSCQHCQNPTPATLYDVDMQVQVVKSGQQNQLLVPWMSNPRPIDQVFSELIKKLPDLVKKFAPTPYEEQVTLFGGAAPTAQQPAYGQYSAPAGYTGYPPNTQQ